MEFPVGDRQISELALRESEQRYKRLLAATTDYIYSVDLDSNHRTTTHGPGCEAVTGYSPSEFATDPYLWYRVIYDEDRPSVIAQVARIMNGDTPPPLEHRVICKDGSIRWISNTPIPHRDSAGRLLGYDGLIKDVTHRKRAEQFLTSQYTVTRDLAESKTVEQALPKVLADICTLLFWDRGGYWSIVPTTMEFRNQAAWFRTPPAIRELKIEGASGAHPGNRSLVQRAWSSGEPVWVSDLGQTKDTGSGIAPSSAGLHCGCAIPVRAAGEVKGVIDLYSFEIQKLDSHMLQVLCGLAGQISLFLDQKEAEEALRRSEERLALVIEGSSDGIWDWDVATGQAYFSPRWKSMLGYADHEIENTYSSWAQLTHPEDREKAAASVKAYFEGQTRTYELEHRLRHKDGSYRWILARGVVLRSADGKPQRMAGSHVDLTERKFAEERLRRANEQLATREALLKRLVRKVRASHRDLKQAQLHLIQAAKLESVGTLAAGVAHEVKNPLQTIIMGLDFLRQRTPSDDKDVAGTLGDMREAVRRASTIIRELLLYSSDTGFQTRPEDLNNVIECSLRLLNANLAAARTEIVRNLAKDLPPVPIDPTKIEQVFINLFLNAIQAMPEGGRLTLTTRAVRIQEGDPAPTAAPSKFKNGDLVILAEVEDTGHGIPQSVLPRVFDPFFTTKPVGVGTGLGLSIAKKIVDLHGGEIQIKNLPTGGVGVTVALQT